MKDRLNWEKYFNWRFYHPAKIPAVTALILFIALIVVVIATPTPAPGESQVATMTAVIVLRVLCAGFFIWAMTTYFSAKGKFIDGTVDAWEKDNTVLPTNDSVPTFLNNCK